MGFAPNPFHGMCTLAACKPKIRKYAHVGDYIIGTGAKKRRFNGRLIYIMRVGEIISFDEYWLDKRYSRKKPLMNGGRSQCYGDNIYHRDATGIWLQEDSFHSQENGILDPPNLKRDTATTENVLIADWFIYWGDRGPAIPIQFVDLVRTGIGHKSETDPVKIESFVTWSLTKGASNTVLGDPVDWAFLA